MVVPHELQSVQEALPRIAALGGVPEDSPAYNPLSNAVMTLPPQMDPARLRVLWPFLERYKERYGLVQPPPLAVSEVAPAGSADDEDAVEPAGTRPASARAGAQDPLATMSGVTRCGMLVLVAAVGAILGIGLARALKM